ncbi:hypothetical protein C8J57DRAFT_1492452 [Mycena rebaudengoi]|nr:hypothetical protein C8J57DRAFT_1492452 [Mycena rebaudengoi]
MSSCSAPAFTKASWRACSCVLVGLGAETPPFRWEHRGGPVQEDDNKPQHALKLDYTIVNVEAAADSKIARVTVHEGFLNYSPSRGTLLCSAFCALSASLANCICAIDGAFSSPGAKTVIPANISDSIRGPACALALSGELLWGLLAVIYLQPLSSPPFSALTTAAVAPLVHAEFANLGNRNQICGPFVPAPRSFVRDAAIVHAHAATRFLAMRVFCEGSAAPVRWATSIPAIWRHVCSSPKAVR